VTHRQRILATLTGEAADRPPVAPDLSEWLKVNRAAGTLPDRYAGMDLLSLHRDIGAGLPWHAYGEFLTVGNHRCEMTVEDDGDVRTKTIRTPRGALREVSVRTDASAGSYFRREHFVKEIADLEILAEYLTDRTFAPDVAGCRRVLDWLGEDGVMDLVVPKSCLPMLLNNQYVEMSAGIMMLMDHPAACEALMAAVEEAEVPFFGMLGALPARLAIFPHNLDVTMIPPNWFERYLLPYYRRHCRILHEADKVVSVHADGRLRPLLGLLARTEIDVLDGCTPAPMNDYEPEELAAAIPDRMRLWMGVPATLFCQRGVTADQIRSFARRILDTFPGRVVLNVGDQLPPNGDIEKVRALIAAAEG